jgi:glycosyltransferase involved in cell wall biosynthesis
VTPKALPPVLLLADHLGYSGGVSHGVGTYFLQVLPQLRAAGLDVTACFLKEPHPAAARLRALGIDPIFLQAGKWNPGVVRQVVAAARACGAGLLHVTGLKGSLVGRAVARALHLPVVLHTHDLNKPVFTRPLQLLLSRPSDFAVCVSGAAQELTVRAYCVGPERAWVIPNGLKLESIQDLSPLTRPRVRRELGLESGCVALAMIGRMHPVKGHRLMLRMLASLVARCPLVRLLVIGDGPERSACEALAGQLGLRGYVRFLGQRDDVPQLLAAADILVAPSRSEGLCLAAIEALAAGKPVVGFAVGGLVEVIRDRVNGLLVPPADAGAFARAVINLVEDEGARRTYGKQGAQDAQRFSVEGHVTRLLECYRCAIDAHQAGGVGTTEGVSE